VVRPAARVDTFFMIVARRHLPRFSNRNINHIMAATTSVDHSDAATVAFLAFLRTESDLCLQRAKALRSQADQLASLYGITQHLQDRYGETNEELLPSPTACFLWILSVFVRFLWIAWPD
jgi:hypothetical protein